MGWGSCFQWSHLALERKQTLSEQQPLSYHKCLASQYSWSCVTLGLLWGPLSLPSTPCLPSHHSSASYCFLISQELFSPFLSFLCFCHFFSIVRI